MKHNITIGEIAKTISLYAKLEVYDDLIKNFVDIRDKTKKEIDAYEEVERNRAKQESYL